MNWHEEAEKQEAGPTAISNNGDLPFNANQFSLMMMAASQETLEGLEVNIAMTEDSVSQA